MRRLLTGVVVIVALLFAALQLRGPRAELPLDAGEELLVLQKSNRGRHRRNVVVAPITAQPKAAAEGAANGSSIADGCRLVALGDVHGDFEGMLKALHAAKLVDLHGTWSGGCATLVQTGDVVDRGPDSIKCLRHLRKLKDQAAEEHGSVITLIGNHELTNYVNEGELVRYGGAVGWSELMAPHGQVRSLIDANPIVAVIEETLFVHGGLTPEFARHGVQRLNDLAWAQLKSGKLDFGVFGDAGPLWSREAIMNAKEFKNCDGVDETLKLVGARRMVIGHTIQEDGKVHSYCNGKLVAIDTGLSRALLGHPSCVEFPVGASRGSAPPKFIYPESPSWG